MVAMSPEQILATYPTFTVAIMVKPTDAQLRVQRVRCKDLHDLYDFVRRITNVGSINDLYFFEVHQNLEDGKIAVLLESSIPWPKVKVEKSNTLMVPSLPKSTDIAEKVRVLIANARDNLPEDIVPDPPKTKDEDYLRPLINYKLQVA